MDVFVSLFPILIVWVIVGLAIGKNAGKNRKTAAPKPPVAQEPERVRRPSNAGEGHVATIGPDIQSRLEQLETLKSAGLLDPEEYAEKKRKILRG